MSFATCPSCGKTSFVKETGECPYCGVILEAGPDSGPVPSGDHGVAGSPRNQRLSCLIAGIAATIAIIGAALFVVIAARG